NLPFDRTLSDCRQRGSTTTYSSDAPVRRIETLIDAGPAGGCQSITSRSICSVVKVRALQFFLFAEIALFLPAALLRGELSSGTTYSLSFVDMDGNKVPRAEGHIAGWVPPTPADREKARTVGDRVPDYCLGNPDYRMITIIHFARRLTPIGRKLISGLVKRRVNEEAKRLQA